MKEFKIMNKTIIGVNLIARTQSRKKLKQFLSKK